MKIISSLRQSFAIALAVILTFGLVLPANAQAITSTPATVSVSYTLGESITVSATPSSVTFVGSPATTGLITVTTTWTLGSISHSFVDTNWGFSSAAGALIGTGGNLNKIPSGSISDNMGGTYRACNQAAGAAELTPLLAVGAICNNGGHIPLTTSNLAGSQNYSFNLQITGSTAGLQADTYSGTLTVVAGTPN